MRRDTLLVLGGTGTDLATDGEKGMERDVGVEAGVAADVIETIMVVTDTSTMSYEAFDMELI